MNFSWLSQIFDALLSMFPRRNIVRNTDRGVKWSLWRKPRALSPGVRWYWPLISDVEIIPTARQVTSLSSQTLLTTDKASIAVAGVVVWEIRNILKAIGERNYNVEDTITEVSRAAIVSVITSWGLEELQSDMEGIGKSLTAECRKQLCPFGVYVYRVALTDFTVCQAHSLLGIPEFTQPE